VEGRKPQMADRNLSGLPLDNISTYLEQFLWRLLRGDILPEEAAQQLQVMGFVEDEAAAIILGSDNAFELQSHSTRSECYAFLDDFKKHAESFLADGWDNVPVIACREDLTLIVIYFAALSPGPGEFAGLIRKHLREKMNCSFTAAVGSRQPFNKIALSYKEAQILLRQRIISGGDKVIVKNGNQSNAQVSILIELENTLEAALRFGDSVTIHKCLRNIVAVAMGGHSSPSGIYQLCYDILELAFKVTRDLDIKLRDDLLPVVKGQEIFHLVTCSDVGSWLKGYFDEIIREISKINAGPPLAIRKALAYIEDHFREDLSLSGLAAHVGLSTCYLSQLFRQETGATFNDHIMEKRMEEAKRLLLQSELHISEIAYKIGYGSPRYFSSLFQKRDHVTPSEYRRGVRQNPGKQ